MGLVKVEMDGRVALVTLDDPTRRNALSRAMAADLTGAIAHLEADESVVGVVITGAGPAFCAGADRSELANVDENGLREIYGGFVAVRNSPLPIVAAVNGPAVGAGMNLALAGDVRITCPEARFDTRFLNLGIHPGGGHTWMLQRLVGPQAAAAMVLFSEVISGEEAPRRGIAWKCVPMDELISAAIALVKGAGDVSRELMLRTKATLRETGADPIESRIAPGKPLSEPSGPGATRLSFAEALELELAAQLWSIQAR